MIPPLAILVAVLSATVFGALALMPDRRRGTVLAQGALVLAAIAVFGAIVAGGGTPGAAPRGVAAVGVGVLSAAVAGMLYHLYLGRFARVWAARGVFFAVYLILSALFGLLFLSLI